MYIPSVTDPVPLPIADVHHPGFKGLDIGFAFILPCIPYHHLPVVSGERCKVFAFIGDKLPVRIYFSGIPNFPFSAHYFQGIGSDNNL